jgi:hypothetical protein
MLVVGALARPRLVQTEDYSGHNEAKFPDYRHFLFNLKATLIRILLGLINACYRYVDTLL